MMEESEKLANPMAFGWMTEIVKDIDMAVFCLNDVKKVLDIMRMIFPTEYEEIVQMLKNLDKINGKFGKICNESRSIMSDMQKKQEANE